MFSILSFTKHALNTLAFALLAQGIVIPDGLEKRDGAGFVALDFDVVRNPLNMNLTQFIDGDLAKRNDVPLTLHDKVAYYSSSITVGSNKQPQTVLVDTGSSDLWIVDVNAQCQDDIDCKDNGTFDPKTSTTYQSLGTQFSIVYGDETSSQGPWAKDTVSFGGISITGQQFADVNSTSSDVAVMGIGFKSGESVESGENYDNIPITLKKQGFIKSTAYSLYLNSPGAATGQLIFGGVDNAKYSGNLIAETITSPDRLIITLDTIDYAGTAYNYSDGALLDSGTTLTFLRSDIASQIAKQVGATWVTNDSSGDGQYVIDCDASVSGNVAYTFEKGAKITVPLSEFIHRTHSKKCLWGIQPKRNFAILGDNFLRHAYLLYNLDANTISIAQVKYTSDSNIVAV
ncbi:SAP8 [Candida oxycetoniae]|uniref:candidapepsin n=1 Tax=Candida oxycetoniae TaxID=497107 RepID=A0AAI9SZH4_9ASCO|nr:SAP8 [Candida oxycetoniae]KAI3405204.2 SAP8 [Candida oxycetoniae]